MASPPTKSVRDAYDLWSATYDSVANPTRDLSAAALRARHVFVAGADVIEIGCGTGINTAWLAERARTVTAIGGSAGMLEAARRKIAAENVSFLQHDIRRPWPVAAAACDQVICALVLEHIEELAPPFAHAAKALRRGGRLFVCEYHPAKQLLGKKANFVDPSTGVVVDFPAYLHDIADYVAAARQAGLTLDDLTEWRDPGAAKTDVPRLVSLEFVRPKPPPAE